MSVSRVADATAAEVAPQSLYVLAVLSLLMAFASISTDLYLPALPVMTAKLGSSAGAMEFTISGYLAGFAVGQLIWGPIGDRFGRKIPVAVGLALFVAGAAGCAVSTSAPELIGWRLLQALGACAGVTLGRAMVRDLYAGARAAQMLSTLMTVMAIAPLLGPLAGAEILRLGSWQAIFWFLVGIGLLTVAALAALPETLPAGRRNREPLLRAFAAYSTLVRQRRILGYAGASGFFYVGIFAYVAGTPFAYIGYYRLSPQAYAVLFGSGMIGMMAANMLNARLAPRFGIVTLLRAGVGLAALSGVAAAVDAWTGFGGLVGFAAPLLICIGANGFIVANSVVGALADFPDRAGAVSAMIGAAQYGSGILGSALVGVFEDGTPRPLGVIMALAGLGACLCAWAFVDAPDRS